MQYICKARAFYNSSTKMPLLFHNHHLLIYIRLEIMLVVSACVARQLSINIVVTLIIILALIMNTYQFISSGGEQPLTEDELRILTIVLTEHLADIKENGLNLEAAISGQQEIKKTTVVESLRQIGQENISKILNNKQGRNNPT